MDQVEIDSVERLPLPRDHLQGFELEVPVPGDSASWPQLRLEGWMLGKSGRAEAVELLQDGRPVLRLPVHTRRGDLAAAFPSSADAAVSGFSGAVGALHLRSNFELLVRGVLRNGTTTPLATIAGRRRPIEVPAGDGPQPLILTTLGRTGSTWCVWLLQSHPEIVAHSPFENDARVGTYWMSVLQTLSDPGSYLRQVYPGDVTDSDWWVGQNLDMPSGLKDTGLATWLGEERIRELAVTCRERVCSFYEYVASAQGKRATFFVEKHLPRHIPAELLRETCPGAAEVVLARDLRDVFSSVLAFNRKRGYEAFGRESATSDEEYVETVRASGEALLRHMRSAGPSAHLVRYEDLVQEPVETLEPLLAFLNLDPVAAPSMVERASISTKEMDHHMTAPSASASIGRWRNDLEPDLVERCEEVLAPLAAEFGYALAVDNSPVPNG